MRQYIPRNCSGAYNRPMKIAVGKIPLEIPDDLIDCEEFVFRLVTIAPKSITMDKDARTVFNFSKGQEKKIGEALSAFPKIKKLGVSKPSLLGAALTRMYLAELLEPVIEIMHNEQITVNLMHENRVEEVAKKNGFDSVDSWIDSN